MNYYIKNELILNINRYQLLLALRSRREKRSKTDIAVAELLFDEPCLRCDHRSDAASEIRYLVAQLEERRFVDVLGECFWNSLK
jgi:hypothetical protein